MNKHDHADDALELIDGNKMNADVRALKKQIGCDLGDKWGGNILPRNQMAIDYTVDYLTAQLEAADCHRCVFGNMDAGFPRKCMGCGKDEVLRSETDRILEQMDKLEAAEPDNKALDALSEALIALIDHREALPTKNFTPKEYRDWDNEKIYLLNNVWTATVRKKTKHEIRKALSAQSVDVDSLRKNTRCINLKLTPDTSNIFANGYNNALDDVKALQNKKDK